MKNRGRYIIALIVAIALLAILHHSFRYYTASLVVLPVSLAWFLVSITPMPVISMGIVAFLLELVSTLPFGTMIGIIAIPVATKLITKTQTDFTWKYFVELFLGITVSIGAIILVKNGFHIMPVTSIPFTIAGLQILCTTGSTFVIAIIFHEYISRP